MAVAEWYIPYEHKVLRSALNVAICAAMSEIQDRLQKRKERLQTIGLQPDGHLGPSINLIHCICEEKSHQNDE